MECRKIKYSDHAFMQMFYRNISFEVVEDVLRNGITIEEYPDDNPYPSRLLFGFVKNRPIHMVVAFEENKKTCIIVTAYQPDEKWWTSNFKTRKK